MSQATQLDGSGNNTGGYEPPDPTVKSASSSSAGLNPIPTTEINVPSRKLGCGKQSPWAAVDVPGSPKLSRLLEALKLNIQANFHLFLLPTLSLQVLSYTLWIQCR